MTLCQNGNMFGWVVMHCKSSHQSHGILLVDIQTWLMDVRWYGASSNQTVVRAPKMGQMQSSNDFFDMSNEIFIALDCKCIRCYTIFAC
jgi:hypothetical protein